MQKHAWLVTVVLAVTICLIPSVSSAQLYAADRDCGCIYSYKDTFATVVSLAFSAAFATMAWPKALVFGPAFAVIGQMGDLAESMMKRDAQQKDSSNRVPGFGGILDVIDSPLVAAPFGYLFFRFVV